MLPENGTEVISPINMVIASPSMRNIFNLLPKVARSGAAVLIRGESGTGKELVARQIHNHSGRPGPFVSINCAAIPADLLESILFGHKRGSFTGATRDGQGLMVSAQHGTFFLDEVGEMPVSTQVKLLRALQEKEVLPVGSTKSVQINCRIIASTNADLEQKIKDRVFRPDLLYRLNVIDLVLPPLRERIEDVPPLTRHFLAKFAGDNHPQIDGEAMFLLMRHDWPGNIRQLENAMERAVVLDQDGEIRVDDLPAQFVCEARSVKESGRGTPLLKLKEVERRHIEAVMKLTGGDKTRAVVILGVSKNLLNRRLCSYRQGVRATVPLAAVGSEPRPLPLVI